MDEQNYRIQELERKVRGLQCQVGQLVSQGKRTEHRVRDLEIRTAVLNGTPQKTVAKVYELSPGRVSQIMKKVA